MVYSRQLDLFGSFLDSLWIFPFFTMQLSRECYCFKFFVHFMSICFLFKNKCVDGATSVKSTKDVGVSSEPIGRSTKAKVFIFCFCQTHPFELSFFLGKLLTNKKTTHPPTLLRGKTMVF